MEHVAGVNTLGLQVERHERRLSANEEEEEEEETGNREDDGVELEFGV